MVPSGIEVMEAVARITDPEAIVWRGDTALQSENKGVRILGTPLGHRDFVRAQLASLSATHDQLIEKVPTLPDLQCAWMVLLYCCAARANYTVRVVHPELTAGLAAHHDASLRRCLSQLLDFDPNTVYWDLANLPLSLGGLGLRSATLMSRPAYWSSWAECLGVVQQRHPTVSACIVQALNHQRHSFPLTGLRACGAQLTAVGFHAPNWEELAHGARPEPVVWDADFDPGIPRHGWQRFATIPVDGVLVEGSVRPRLFQSEQALFRSQAGPLPSVPFTCFPTSPLSRFDACLFRVFVPHASAGVASP